MDRIEVGKLGENYAVQFLLTYKYSIITTNYHTRYGELDIIAITDSGELVFVEVKTRASMKFGQPEQAITYKKRQRLTRTALHFLSQSRGKYYRSWRMDLVAVKLNLQYQLEEINHYKHIFDG